MTVLILLQPDKNQESPGVPSYPLGVCVCGVVWIALADVRGPTLNMGGTIAWVENPGPCQVEKELNAFTAVPLR